MPELNKLSETDKSDSSIVFLTIALDKKYEIEQFLKGSHFGYTIIDNGRFITDQYSINSYPTNVVVDQNGKVYFHSSGLGHRYSSLAEKIDRGTEKLSWEERCNS